MLGSDARPKGSKEPGAGGAEPVGLDPAAAGRARQRAASCRSRATRRREIPGHGIGKINSAYALGGAPLAIETVEGYLGNGLQINHLIEVNFENFPDFIDALGGIDVKLKKCVRSPPFGEYGTEGGRKALRFSKGENHLSGHQALGFSRIRKNSCDPNEDDRDRAARQQQVAVRHPQQATSPRTFFRLPWVAWDAPRTVRSDMAGFGLSALFLDLMTGGSGKTHVLEPTRSSRASCPRASGATRCAACSARTDRALSAVTRICFVTTRRLPAASVAVTRSRAGNERRPAELRCGSA